MPAFWQLRNTSAIVQNGATMHTQAQVVSALRKVENKSDFASRHELAERTIYNLLTPGHHATKNTLKVVGAALMADGLLKVVAQKKTARKKAAT